MSDASESDPDKKKTKRSSKRKKRHLPHKRGSEDTGAIIERLWLSPIQTMTGGKPAKITALKAIMYQLLQKEFDGQAGASRCLRKYRQLARRIGEQRPRVVFAENEYSQSLAQLKPKRRDG